MFRQLLKFSLCKSRYVAPQINESNVLEIQLTAKQFAKKTYKMLIEKQKPVSAVRFMWEQETGVLIHGHTWYNLLMNIDRISNDTRLRTHQYKLLN